MTTYRPFILRIEHARDGVYPVTAEFEGHIRQGSIPVALPLLDQDECRQAQTWLERGLIDTAYAQDFGNRLFRTLFVPPVEAFFREAFRRAVTDGGLRVVLSTPLPDVLASIPWELLYDRAGSLGHLARSSQCPLVRLYSAGPVSNPPVRESPFRILVMWASPSDQFPLSSQAEVEGIVAALSRSDAPVTRLRVARAELRKPGGWSSALKKLRKRTHVDLLGHVTRVSLEQRLATARSQGKPFHAVHFIGHSYHSSAEGGTDDEAFLLFENLDGTSDPIPAEDFAQAICTPVLNIVVLNACGSASAANFLGSAARALLEKGVPVVVGMQVPVLDSPAVDFSRAFYTALAAGDPVESALATARRLITHPGRAAAADWSIPAIYMGTAAGLSLDLPAPPFRLPLPLHMGRAALLSFVTLMGIMTALLAVPNTARQIRTQAPVIRCVWPYPMEDSADKFNVVMTPFTRLNESGRVEHLDREGAKLAAQLYSLMKGNLAGAKLGETLELELRGPNEGCALRGATSDERARAAEALAEDVNASIILYGVISDTVAGPRFIPEFHVAYEGFEQGTEITGPYALGREIIVDLPITADHFRGANNAATIRTRGLSLIVLGLAAYSRDDLREAEAYFRQAAESVGLLEDEGQEVVYLFLGNTYLRLADTESNSSLLENAEHNYAIAHKLATQYGHPSARPHLGLANVIYGRALGDLKERSIYNVDSALLDQAEEAYKAVLQADAPSGAQIPLKVAYDLGQIYLLRHMIFGGEWLSEAEAQLAQVTDAYRSAEKERDEGTKTALRARAAEAYAALGTAANWRKDTEGAIALYEQAAEIASPRRQVLHYLAAGDICRENKQIERARTYYDKAERIAHDVVHDGALVNRARESRTKLAEGP